MSLSDQLAEIGRLKSEVVRLRAALKPFVEEAKMYEPSVDDGTFLFAIDEDGEKSECGICVGDLRRAKAALE